MFQGSYDNLYYEEAFSVFFTIDASSNNYKNILVVSLKKIISTFMEVPDLFVALVSMLISSRLRWQ